MKDLFTILSLLLLTFFALLSDALRPSSRHRTRPSGHHRKPHHKRGNQLYGVSLSSITGFEKPMIPPRIINFDIPINYEQPPMDFGDLATLDLPSKVEDATNSTLTITPIELQ